MAEKTVWTDWNENPLAAAYEVARTYHLDTKKIDGVLLKVATWQQFEPRDFLDDLLQEIAGETSIVVQYSEDGKQYRAALDL